MKTKIKRYSRSALSILLTLCMLVSCMTVGIIATDAATADKDDTVGSSYGFKGSFPGLSWETEYPASVGTEYSFTVTETGTYYLKVFVDSNQYGVQEGTTISNTQEYNFDSSKTGTNDSLGIVTTVTGTFKLKIKGEASNGSVTVQVTYPEDPSSVTWSVTGNNTALFGGDGTNWPTSIAANDMTPNSDYSVYTWTKNAVTLGDGTIYYKVIKNHEWSGSYPAGNDSQSENVSAGVYNVTITYNTSPQSLTISLTPLPPHNLMIANIADATVTATYGNTTIHEGGNMSVPETMEVSILADTGVNGTVVDSITTNNSATFTGSAKHWKLTMPALDTTITGVTTRSAVNKTVYFNNANTKYSQVIAYVYYKDGAPGNSTTGQMMTKMSNSNIYSIEVPEDVETIVFEGGNGAKTDPLTIPWGDYKNPKYTAGEDPEDPDDGGTWGNYRERDNVYTVSAGSTLDNSSLFTGIKATFYDYYVDGEIADGWITGIKDDEYNMGSNWKWIPFRTLDYNLSKYANNTDIPKNDITYPLYFGNLNYADNASEVSFLYHFKKKANNGDGLGNDGHNAVIGLTGTTLANDTIHHYKAGDDTENGAEIAFFNDDFLSGENATGEQLATILHSSHFPVRKEENVGGTVSGITKIYLDPGTTTWAVDGNTVAALDACFDGSTWKQMTLDSASGYYVAEVPSGATTVKFTRADKHYGEADRHEWNASGDITLSLSGSGAKNIYTCTSVRSGTFDDSLDTSLDGCTATGGHTLYEYDSTNGKDNAFITNINETDHTAQLDYYNKGSGVYVQSNTSKKGYYPFDYNNIIGNTGDIATSNYADPTNHFAHNLGYGTKLEIPFRLGANGLNEDGTAQIFEFSGDDDLWVFIDGNLVLDLGGAHGATEGSINFSDCSVSAPKSEAMDNDVSRNGSFGKSTNSTGGVANGWFDNTNPNIPHTMTIYYMERGMFDSNLHFSFTFHPIPNQYKTEKKIRTTGRETSNPNTANYIPAINNGFYRDNGEAHTITQGENTVENPVSNYATDLSKKWDRPIYKFERSYQDEVFAVTHKSSVAPPMTDQNGKVIYSIGETSYEVVPDAADSNKILYEVKNDEIAYFMGQYSAGSEFTLSEDTDPSGANNKYRYITDMVAFDDGNNGSLVPVTKSGSNYTFTYGAADTDNINIRARFLNYMKSHDLTVTKTIDNAVDTTTEFTLQFLFDFEGTDEEPVWVAYPLVCELNGAETSLSVRNGDTAPGTIKIKSTDTLVIKNIPENAKIKIIETVPSKFNYVSTNVTSGDTQVVNDTTNVTVFNMPAADASVTVHNEKEVATVDIVKTLNRSGDTSTTFPVKVKVYPEGQNTAAQTTYMYKLNNAETPTTVDNVTDWFELNITSADTLHILGVPDGAWVEVAEGTLDTNGNFTFDSIDVDSNIAASPAKDDTVTQQIGFTVDGTKNPTVTIANNVKTRDVKIYKKTYVDKVNTDEFVMTLGLTLNGGASSDITSSDVDTDASTVTTVTNNTVTLNKDDYITLKIPVDATLSIQETGMPSTFYFEKITTTEGSSDVSSSGVYTVDAGTATQNVYVYNLKKIKLDVSKAVTGTTLTNVPFLFRILTMTAYDDNSPSDYTGSFSIGNLSGDDLTARKNDNQYTLYAGETLTIDGLTHNQFFRIYEVVPTSGYNATGRAMSGGIDSANATDYDTETAYGKNFQLLTSDGTLTFTNQKVKTVQVTKLIPNAPHAFEGEFKIRIQQKVNDTWKDLYGGEQTSLYKILSGTNHSNTAISRNATPHYDNSDPDHPTVDYYYYIIKKDDVLNVPSIPGNTELRIIECELQTGYYTYDSTQTAAANSSLTDYTANAAADGNGFSFKVNADAEHQIATIVNNAVTHDVTVKKQTNFYTDDDSKFTVLVKSNPFNNGDQTLAGYSIKTDGIVYNANDAEVTLDQAGNALKAQGKYELQKGWYVVFNNVTHGSRFIVEELAYGDSSVTKEQRFTLDTITDGTTITTSSNMSSQYFEVDGNKTIIVNNKVFKNDLWIQKQVNRPVGEAVDTNSTHTIKIDMWKNGQPANADAQASTHYKPSGDLGNDELYPDIVKVYSSTDNGQNFTEITSISSFPYEYSFKEGEIIKLTGVYAGSFVSVEETTLAENYQFVSISADHVADYPTVTDPNAAGYKYNSLPKPTVSGRKITFQTKNLTGSDEHGSVTIQNEPIRAKTITVKKFIQDINSTTVTDTASEFTINIQTSADGNSYSNIEGTYKKSGSDISFVNGNATLKGGDEITFDVDVNKYVKVTESVTDTDMPFLYRFKKILVDSDTTEHANGYAEQVTDEITFNVYNELYANCEIVYNYEAYSSKTYLSDTNKNDEGRVIGANRSFTKSIPITAENLGDFNFNNSEKTLSFKTDPACDTLVENSAPYVDDFMLNLKWKDAPKVVSAFDNTNKKLQVSTTAISDPQRKVYVYFKLPYQNYDESTLWPSGNYTPDVTRQVDKETQYGNWVSLNGKYDDENEAQFVSAPLSIQGTDGQTYYFKYWQIQSASGDTRNVGKIETNYKKCYYFTFNMTMYQDSYVTPIYNTDNTGFNPNAASLHDTENGEASINFIENSRNQWNNNGGDSSLTGNKKIAGDRIYSDFLLTYGYKDKELRSVSNEETSKIKVGYVLERVAELDKDNEGHYYTRKQSDYHNNSEYGFSENAAVTKVAEYLSNSATQMEGVKAKKTVDEKTQFINKTVVSLKQLDNKNQMKLSVNLTNKSYESLEQTETKKYVYRAYSYIQMPGEGTNVTYKVSAPVYFTIYDMASIETGQDAKGGQS